MPCCCGSKPVALSSDVPRLPLLLESHPGQAIVMRGDGSLALGDAAGAIQVAVVPAFPSGVRLVLADDSHQLSLHSDKTSKTVRLLAGASGPESVFDVNADDTLSPGVSWRAGQLAVGAGEKEAGGIILMPRLSTSEQEDNGGGLLLVKIVGLTFQRFGQNVAVHNFDEVEVGAGSGGKLAGQKPKVGLSSVRSVLAKRATGGEGKQRASSFSHVAAAAAAPTDSRSSADIALLASSGSGGGFARPSKAKKSCATRFCRCTHKTNVNFKGALIAPMSILLGNWWSLFFFFIMFAPSVLWYTNFYLPDYLANGQRFVIASFLLFLMIRVLVLVRATTSDGSVRMSMRAGRLKLRCSRVLPLVDGPEMFCVLLNDGEVWVYEKQTDFERPTPQLNAVHRFVLSDFFQVLEWEGKYIKRLHLRSREPGWLFDTQSPTDSLVIEPALDWIESGGPSLLASFTFNDVGCTFIGGANGEIYRSDDRGQLVTQMQAIVRGGQAIVKGCKYTICEVDNHTAYVDAALSFENASHDLEMWSALISKFTYAAFTPFLAPRNSSFSHNESAALRVADQNDEGKNLQQWENHVYKQCALPTSMKRWAAIAVIYLYTFFEMKQPMLNFFQINALAFNSLSYWNKESIFYPGWYFQILGLNFFELMQTFDHPLLRDGPGAFASMCCVVGLFTLAFYVFTPLVILMLPDLSSKTFYTLRIRGPQGDSDNGMWMACMLLFGALVGAPLAGGALIGFWIFITWATSRAFTDPRAFEKGGPHFGIQGLDDNQNPFHSLVFVGSFLGIYSLYLILCGSLANVLFLRLKGGAVAHLRAVLRAALWVNRFQSRLHLLEDAVECAHSSPYISPLTTDIIAVEKQILKMAGASKCPDLLERVISAVSLRSSQYEGHDSDLQGMLNQARSFLEDLSAKDCSTKVAVRACAMKSGIGLEELVLPTKGESSGFILLQKVLAPFAAACAAFGFGVFMMLKMASLVVSPEDALSGALLFGAAMFGAVFSPWVYSNRHLLISSFSAASKNPNLLHQRISTFAGTSNSAFDSNAHWSDDILIWDQHGKHTLLKEVIAQDPKQEQELMILSWWLHLPVALRNAYRPLLVSWAETLKKDILRNFLSLYSFSFESTRGASPRSSESKLLLNKDYWEVICKPVPGFTDNFKVDRIGNVFAFDMGSWAQQHPRIQAEWTSVRYGLSSTTGSSRGIWLSGLALILFMPFLTVAFSKMACTVQPEAPGAAMVKSASKFAWLKRYSTLDSSCARPHKMKTYQEFTAGVSLAREFATFESIEIELLVNETGRTDEDDVARARLCQETCRGELRHVNGSLMSLSYGSPAASALFLNISRSCNAWTADLRNDSATKTAISQGFQAAKTTRPICSFHDLWPEPKTSYEEPLLARFVSGKRDLSDPPLNEYCELICWVPFKGGIMELSSDVALTQLGCTIFVVAGLLFPLLLGMRSFVVANEDIDKFLLKEPLRRHDGPALLTLSVTQAHQPKDILPRLSPPLCDAKLHIHEHIVYFNEALDSDCQPEITLSFSAGPGLDATFIQDRVSTQLQANADGQLIESTHSISSSMPNHSVVRIQLNRKSDGEVTTYLIKFVVRQFSSFGWTNRFLYFDVVSRYLLWTFVYRGAAALFQVMLVDGTVRLPLLMALALVDTAMLAYLVPCAVRFDNRYRFALCSGIGWGMCCSVVVELVKDPNAEWPLLMWLVGLPVVFFVAFCYMQATSLAVTRRDDLQAFMDHVGEPLQVVRIARATIERGSLALANIYDTDTFLFTVRNVLLFIACIPIAACTLPWLIVESAHR